MTYSHLLSLLKDAHLSPEQLAKRLGISGMTVRRWQEKDPHEELPLLYQKALQDVVRQLVAESRLSLDSPVVKAITAEGAKLPMVTSENSLGITQGMLQEAQHNPKHLVESLSQLGANEAKKAEVDHHKKKILSFKRMGKEWSSRISSLMKVLESDELTTFDKLVAYGALFYLICPFDLIPDYIPVFGYMDDFIVLGFAVAYYAKRFPHLVGHHKKHGP
jgi:uncharacterized membrane protein YkvA (DUF1232 family)